MSKKLGITIITGNAGTGKSYLLAKYINSVKDKKIAVLAFTHAAVNNIKNICKEQYGIDRECFYTIHKYFRVNIETGTVNAFHIDYVDILFIDEYSLISTKLFSSILPFMYGNVGKLVLCGDYKQLKTIDSSELIEYNDLIEYSNKYTINKSFLISLRHYRNSILSLSKVRKNILGFVNLNENKRSNTEITKIVNSLCFSNSEIQEISNILTNHLVSKKDLRKLINNGATFIASRYKYLQEVHNSVEQNAVSFGEFMNGECEYFKIKNTFEKGNKQTISSLLLKPGMNITITENIDEYTNGDSFVFVDYSEQGKYILMKDDNEEIHYLKPKQGDKWCYYPVLPKYLTTYHKSQGLSINEVILCLNTLFDFTMLYTGLTRARNKIYFYIDDDTSIDTFAKDIYDYNKSFAILDKLMKDDYENQENKNK